MNLLLSYDWLREHVCLEVTPEEFAARFSLSGPGVEKIHPIGQDFTHMIVGKVEKILPHPQADKLKVVQVDGGKRTLSIVCGGSNVAEGQWVVVAETGARVTWHGTGDPITLKPVEIRGVASEGMICAASEIGLFDAFPHAEREILDLDIALPDAKKKAGMPLAELLGVKEDVVMDVEVTSNRPDALSVVGMAREAAAILNAPFLWKPAKAISAPRKNRRGPLNVRVSDAAICPRFTAIRLEGITVASSPWWIKRRLLSAGIRPINNVVDITNFVMLELGQPMHAYDAAKLADVRLEVRSARDGESLAALDGKKYALTESMPVIADAEGPVGIAGIMGGERTSVTKDTTSVVFEAATFDPVAVRRTARALNLYSEAQIRFEKGLSTEGPRDALARAVQLCAELCGGSVCSKVADVGRQTYKPTSYRIAFSDLDRLIGLSIGRRAAVAILTRLGFRCQTTKRSVSATVPWWRDHDIESAHDLVEEVARVYGYGQIPATFPSGLARHSEDPLFAWEDRFRTIAAGAGFLETYTYSFVSRELAARAGSDASVWLRVQNPLSSDFEYMRGSLIPSLLQIAAENQERDRDAKLFEIAHVYQPCDTAFSRGTDLPRERLMAAAILKGDDAWRLAKGFVEYIFDSFGIRDVEWRQMREDAKWHPGRSMHIFAHDVLLATLGEIHPAVALRYKFDVRVAAVEIAFDEIATCAKQAKVYVPPPVFPEAKRDAAFIVPRETTVGELSALLRAASPAVSRVEWFDTYRGDGIPEEKKSVAFHLAFVSSERTLETIEVDTMMRQIQSLVRERLGGEMRLG